MLNHILSHDMISKIGSKILSMLNFPSQHTACDFDTSQQLWKTPSQMCSIAACGQGYYHAPSSLEASKTPEEISIVSETVALGICGNFQRADKISFFAKFDSYTICLLRYIVSGTSFGFQQYMVTRHVFGGIFFKRKELWQ